jgi:hypothetical protein
MENPIIDISQHVVRIGPLKKDKEEKKYATLTIFLVSGTYTEDEISIRDHQRELWYSVNSGVYLGKKGLPSIINIYINPFYANDGINIANFSVCSKDFQETFTQFSIELFTVPETGFNLQEAIEDARKGGIIK